MIEVYKILTESYCKSVNLELELHSVISANNVNTFKNRLDKFWANQELIFDYKSSLTGTGNILIGVSLTVLTLSIISFIISYSFYGYRGLGLHPFFTTLLYEIRPRSPIVR